MWSKDLQEKFCYLIMFLRTEVNGSYSHRTNQNSMASSPKPFYNFSYPQLPITSSLQPCWDPSSSLNNSLQHFPTSLPLFTASTWTMIFLTSTNIRRFRYSTLHHLILLATLRYAFPNFTWVNYSPKRSHYFLVHSRAKIQVQVSGFRAWEFIG